MSATPDEIREQHRPARVRLLLVGESPPSGGTFFYSRNSKLYRVTEVSFRAAVPDLIGNDFLAAFVRMGCYLDDLCLMPVNQLKKTHGAQDQLRRAREAGVAPLAERMAEYDPAAIVLVGLGIEKFVRRATQEAGRGSLPFYALPFPNYPEHVDRYADGLREVLVVGRTRGLLDEASTGG